MDFAAGEQLLPGLVDLEQLIVGVDLGVERQQRLLLAADGQFDLFGFQRQDRTVGVERLVRAIARDVLAVDAGGVGFRVVVGGHLLQPSTFDGAAIDGCAFDGDAEKLALGHDRSGSLRVRRVRQQC